MITFGAGVLFGTPLFDINGNSISNPSPVQFGILQEVTSDESYEMKELYGANKFPVAVAQGKGKAMLTAKLANINAELLNTFLYGQSLQSAYENVYNDLSGLAIPTSPYDITPTAPSSGTIVADLGVVSTLNGAPYTRVGTTPTGGQYTYVGGTWGFAAQDQNKTAFISFVYSASVASGRKIPITNQPMGVQPVFQIDLATQFQGKTGYIRYHNVIAASLKRNYKNDDFDIPEFQMQAFADSNGVVAEFYAYE